MDEETRNAGYRNEVYTEFGSAVVTWCTYPARPYETTAHILDTISE